MKKNFLLSLAITTGLVITGFASNVNAGNVKDTAFEFYFSRTGGIAYSNNIRPKYDSTPTYFKFGWIKDGAGGYKVKVVDQNGSGFSRTWWSRYFNDSVPSGTQSWISSYAYEDRGYGVKVKLHAEGGGGTGVWNSGGLWSPDSVRR
ncbi:hypothetical protein ACOAKC_02955 [Hathewaya histolytica]|uniref:hypothetical protein n=1 Tax=Hathewaya histolytica TaxID=1498 RepID=UPI003B67D4A7